MEELVIGELLGEGAWADVFAIRDRPDLVAKVAKASPTFGGNSAEHWWIVTTIVGGTTFPPNAVLRDEAAFLVHAERPFTKLHGVHTSIVAGEPRTTLVLERLYGASLGELVARGEQERARRALPELVLHLDELAGRGRFHGDIKPDNVWLDGDDRIRLIDPSSAFWLPSGRVLLTPIRNPAFVRSDVPALAFMILELVSQPRGWPDRDRRLPEFRWSDYRPFRDDDTGYRRPDGAPDPDPGQLFVAWLRSRDLPTSAAGSALVDLCLCCMGADRDPPALAEISDDLIRKLEALD